MPFIISNTNGPFKYAAQSNMYTSAITGLTAASTVAGQITLSWSGGLGNNVKYSYALSTGTIQSVSGTASPVTITLTSTDPITTTVTLTATVIGGSASAVSNSVTTTPIIIPSVVSANGLPVTFYPFTQDILDYKNNSTGVSDGSTFGTGCVYSATGGYKAGVGTLSEPTVTGGFLTNPLTYTSGTAISFGGWFKFTSSGIFCHISMNGGTNRYFLNNSTGINLGWNGVGVGGAQGASSSAFTSYTNGTWVHIIVVIPSSGNTVAYVNGSLVATPLTSTTISPGATFTNVNTVLFGLNGPSAGVSGYINNFYIFNRTLSATEVTALYNQ